MAAVLIPGIVLAAPLTGSPDGGSGGIPVVPGGDGPFVAHTGAEYKFESGFHAKVLDLMQEPPSDGDPGVFDGSRYYDVIIVVARDDGDGRDHDKTAAENKAAVVEKLKSLGARDIASARSLSFVTASIPVAEIPGFALHDEVYKMGDGELRLVPSVDTSKATINAESKDIRGAIGMDLDGSGVKVAVIDHGIDHTTAFKKDQITRRFCDNTGCDGVTGRIHDFGSGGSSHGLFSGQIIAASNLGSNNGIAPGVELFDIVYTYIDGVDQSLEDRRSSFVHAIDWAFDNGVDIANLSLNGRSSCTGDNNAFDLIANEAVDKGMILVGAVSNTGSGSEERGDPILPKYSSVLDPACAHNVIGVGGINDRDNPVVMYNYSGRGPVTKHNILKPDLVAPGVDIQLLMYNDREIFQPVHGTSVATPFVTATAALMLDARPDLTPVMTKAALLLGASWTGPAACTSGMYEKGRTGDGCSYRNQPDDRKAANNADSLKILNNVGLGILDTAATLGYVAPGTTHVISDHLSVSEPSKKFTFTVDDPTQTKIVLSWLAHPHGSIKEQISARGAPVANLDFVVTDPDGEKLTGASGESDHQTNEFAVFTPSMTGMYTVMVTGSGLGDINKPVQVFALASTEQLTPVGDANRPPVADTQILVLRPGEPNIVRLTGSDPDGDAVTFHVLQDSTDGTVTTDELINSTISRVIYTPPAMTAADAPASDSFKVVPSDGITTGDPALITLNPENLPPVIDNEYVSNMDIRAMDKLSVTTDFSHNGYSQEFDRVLDLVYGIRVSSHNMEGAELIIRTDTRDSYTVAIPGDREDGKAGTRDIVFQSPINVLSVELSSAGIEEEVVHGALRDVRGSATISVEYASRINCAVPNPSDPECPGTFVERVVAQTSRIIPDPTGFLPLSSPVAISRQGTLAEIKVSVRVTHGSPGQLGFSLMAPSGKTVELGDIGPSMKAEYDNTESMRALVGEYVKGVWILQVTDSRAGGSGTLREWTLEIVANSPRPPTAPPTTPQRELFEDMFDSELLKWVESGMMNWATGIRFERTLVEPGRGHDDMILRARSCITTCTVTLKDPIDLTPFETAGLWFSRNVGTNLSSGDFLRAEAYDGSKWVTLSEWIRNRGNDGKWHKEYYNLEDYLDVDDFSVRFVTKQGRSSTVAIDDFRVTTGDGATAPPPEEITLTAGLTRDRSSIILTFSKPVSEEFSHADFTLSHGTVTGISNFDGSSIRHLAVSGVPYDVPVKVTYGKNLQRLASDATPGLKLGLSGTTNPVFNPDPSAARGSVAISDDFESGTDSWSLERYGRIRSVVPATEPGAAIPGLPADNSAMRLYTCYHGCLAQPEGSVDATSPLIVGFDRYVERHSKDDRINVEYSTDSGSTWKVAASFREADGALAGTWVRESVMLDATASVTHLRLAIYVKTGSTYIDNFSVRSIPTSAVPDTATTHAFQFHGGLPSWTLTGDYETLWTAGAPAAAVAGQSAADRAMIASDCDRYCYAQLGYALDASAPLLVSLDKYVDRSASRLDGLYVQYSTDGGTSWTNLAEYTGNTDDDDSTWSREVLSLGAQEGEALLRLAAYSLNDREKVEVDNLVIQQKPPDPASLPAVTLKASLDEANEVMTVVLSTGLHKTFKASDFALDAGSVDSLEHSPGSDTVVLGVSGVPPGREVTVSYTGSPHIVGLNHGAELRRSESATVLSSTPDSPPVIVSISNTTFRSDHWGSIYVQASDPDGDEISFTLVDSPYYIRSSSIVHQDRLALNVGPRHNHVGTDDVSVLVSAGGATTWANFTVTVLDGTPPVFQYIPPSLTFKSVHLLTPVHFNLPRALDYVDWHYTAPGSSKNSKVTSSPQPGDLFPRGTTNVNLTATDKSGNMETAVMAITVTNRDMDPISGLSFSSTGNTTRITWDAHASINPPYKVKLYPEGSYGKRIVFVQDGTSLTFVGLDPDTRYVASVQLPNHKNTRAEGSFYTSQGSGHAEASISGGKVPPVTLLRSETRDVRLVFDAPGDPKIRLLNMRSLASLDDLGNGTAVLTIDPDKHRGKHRILVLAAYGDESLISPVDVVIKNKRVVRGGSVQEAPPPGAAWPGAGNGSAQEAPPPGAAWPGAGNGSAQEAPPPGAAWPGAGNGSAQEAPPPGAAWPGAGNGSAQEAPPIGVAMPDPAAPDTAPDTTPPSIRVGPASEHPYGVPYEDPGATCTDDRDPERTVYSDGAINARSPGPQALRYTCADAAGNEAQPKTRIVVVLDPWEEPKAPAEPAPDPEEQPAAPAEPPAEPGGGQAEPVPDPEPPADTRAPAVPPASGAVPAAQESVFLPPPDIVAEAEGPLTGVDLGTPAAVPLNHTVHNDAPDAFPLGRTVVTWAASGSTGPMHVANQTVTILDTTPPEIAGLPSITANATWNGAVVWFEVPEALDLVDGAVPVTASHEPGGMFPAGNTTVTFVAEDSSGNAATSSVLVTVEPAVDPARGAGHDAAEGRPEPGGPS